MNFEYEQVSQWPLLAWLATCSRGGDRIRVRHGGRVETTAQWFCEAAWEGEYAAGGFDRTDIVTGTGGRLRGTSATFVSPASTLDRLHWSRDGDRILVSNSLACLGEALGASFSPAYTGYFDDFGSIVDGLRKYRRAFDTNRGSIQLTYFDNLHWDGEELAAVPKPAVQRELVDFDAYFRFLSATLAGLNKNAADSARRVPWDLSTTLSSGYDSTTVATLAAGAGCRHAVSFEYGQRGVPDDGRVAAQVLGLDLQVFDREDWAQLEGSELPFIAADAKGPDRYFAAAEDALRGQLLLTGYHGDKIWDRHLKSLSEHLVRGDRSGLSLSEFRLRAGFLHCPVPFWGARQVRDINRISNGPEMAPWDIGGQYNRPICRRIAETAGIPRRAFGIAKRATSEHPFSSEQFLTPSSMDDYLGWLREHRRAIGQATRLPLLAARNLDRMIYRSLDGIERGARSARSVLSRLPILWRLNNGGLVWRLSTAKTLARPMYIRAFVFPWAFERAKQAYRISS